MRVRWVAPPCSRGGRKAQPRKRYFAALQDAGLQHCLWNTARLTATRAGVRRASPWKPRKRRWEWLAASVVDAHALGFLRPGQARDATDFIAGLRRDRKSLAINRVAPRRARSWNVTRERTSCLSAIFLRAAGMAASNPVTNGAAKRRARAIALLAAGQRRPHIDARSRHIDIFAPIGVAVILLVLTDGRDRDHLIVGGRITSRPRDAAIARGRDEDHTLFSHGRDRCLDELVRRA